MKIRLSQFGTRGLRSVSQLFALAALPFALAGCFASGGGSFDVAAADVDKANGVVKQPDFIKGATTKTDDDGEVGFSIYTPTTDGSTNASIYPEDKNKSYSTSSYPLEYRGDATWSKDDKEQGSYVYFIDPVSNKLSSRKAEEDSDFNMYPTGRWTEFESDKSIVSYKSNPETGGYDYFIVPKSFKNDDYVRIGNLDYSQRNSQIFYMTFGGRSKEQPINETVTYTGAFYLAFPADMQHKGRLRGEMSGSLSASDTGTVVLNADFDKKEITGGAFSVSGSEPSVKLDYNVTGGKIEGSFFTGTASGTDNIARGESDDSAAGTMSFKGGFYGKKSNRIAGRFWSTKASDKSEFDGRYVGVYAGKADSEPTETKALYYAGVMTFESSGAQLKAPEDMPYYPKAGAVQIDGKNYELTKDNISGVKLKDFQYVQFGKYQVGEEGQQVGGYFIKGELTDKMPTEGTAKYLGQWTGFGQQTSGTWSPSKPLDASFVANWAEKSLKGGLFQGGDTSNMDNAEVKINANIDGNKFSGTADVNVRIDTDKGTSNDARIKASNAEVQGGFFGPDANELSGTVHATDKSFGAVFGGKQIKNN